jgi:hypothetical protein
LRWREGWSERKRRKKRAALPLEIAASTPPPHSCLSLFFQLPPTSPRVLLREIDRNHDERTPEALNRNCSLIREVNANVNKVVTLYGDISASFESLLRGGRGGGDGDGGGDGGGGEGSGAPAGGSGAAPGGARGGGARGAASAGNDNGTAAAAAPAAANANANANGGGNNGNNGNNNNNSGLPSSSAAGGIGGGGLAEGQTRPSAETAVGGGDGEGG